MSIDLTILRSRFGQRLFLLFVICALVPIGVLSLISFRSVSRELEEQSRIRLRRLAKSQVMSIVERLELLGVELEVLSRQLPSVSGAELPLVLDLDDMQGAARFREVTFQAQESGRIDALPPGGPVRLNPRDSTLVFEGDPDGSTRILLSRPVPLDGGAAGTLRAEIDPPFLWWGPLLENNLPPASELCILDDARVAAIFCPEASEGLRDQLSGDRAALGELEWSRGETDLLASFRTANLEARFGTPGLTVVVSQERSYLLSPLADFKRSFPAIIVASLGVVLLLSIGQIRRRMVPLERLQSGTRRVAARDFSARVTIDSGDEFEQLAEDFNSMADRLGKQFGALRSMNEIVQAVLSALDRREIVHSVLGSFGDVLHSQALSVVLLEENSPTSARCLQLRDAEEGDYDADVVEMTEEELTALRREPRLLMLDPRSGLPSYLRRMEMDQVAEVTVFPIFVEDQLTGMIAAGFSSAGAPAQEDLERARQLADQVAVAFANSELLLQLEKLSAGALTALARSIDAKSHWTAGHSERVAAMAVVLGREAGLTSEELDVLYRGSLLHDLGKIGVSSTILDKPGRLTEAELEIVRGHVRIGARILEPIAQLEGLLPLVWQHHEWFNGEGYPNGLAGEQIDILARALAVVDIYDALRSPRPYRGAIDHETVMQMITDLAGTQLDPQMVGAFIKSEAWQVRGAGAS